MDLMKLGSSYRDPSFCVSGEVASELRYIVSKRPVTLGLAKNFRGIVGNLIGNIHLFTTGATMMLTEEIVL